MHKLKWILQVHVGDQKKAHHLIMPGLVGSGMQLLELMVEANVCHI
jgi:hypothetical protein